MYFVHNVTRFIVCIHQLTTVPCCTLLYNVIMTAGDWWQRCDYDVLL